MPPNPTPPRNELPVAENHSEPQTASDEHEKTPEFVLYSAIGCQCSQTAASVLKQHGIVPVEMDISSNPTLSEKHQGATPLVLVEGRVRFVGQVDPVLLKRLLEQYRRTTQRNGSECG